MVDTLDVPIACSSFGSGENTSCCYVNNQSSPICNSLFPPENSFLENGCLNENCLDNCDPEKLYHSVLQQSGTGTGAAPIFKYLACANVTSVVTDCISSTCRRARNSAFCYPDYCSPVKLLGTTLYRILRQSITV
jgi:hypothetical protein